MAAEELIPALVFRFNKEVSDIEDFLREAKMDEYEKKGKAIKKKLKGILKKMDSSWEIL